MNGLIGIRQKRALAMGLMAAMVHLVATAALSAPALRPQRRVVTGAIVWLRGDSPYYAAGLRTRDLITTAANVAIRNNSDFYRVVAATTTTREIVVEGLRGKEKFRVRLPAFLPADVTVGSYMWDWVRYLKYYARDPANPDPLLFRAYMDFDMRRWPQAQIALTSATAKGHKDPLTSVKLAWLLLRRRTGNMKTRLERAGKLLQQAQDAFDQTLGDKETEAKIEGTNMLYYEMVGNVSLAAVHGRKAMELAPFLVSNRINYCLMLMRAKRFDDAAMAASDLVADYPNAVYFLRLKKNAALRARRIRDVVEACEALVNLMPDDISTRLELLPFLDQIADNYGIMRHCEYLLNNKGSELTDEQRAEICYCQARVYFRRGSIRKAEGLARRAIGLRGNGDDYRLLADILHRRHKWKEAALAYTEALKKPMRFRDRETWREILKRRDEAIEHLWSWQIKKMPPEIQRRKAWLKEREVLKHSFIMRKRYEIRNALIVIGVLMILTGVALKLLQPNY